MTHLERKEKLSPVQRKFVEEYLKDPLDGGEAYMRASGTTNKKSAAVQSSKLLKMDKVQAALKQSAKDVIGFLEARIIQNVEFWLDIRDGKIDGEGEGRLISQRKVREILQEHDIEKGTQLYEDLDDLPYFIVNPIKVTDRMKASENLGKYMQMFVEKKEIDVSGQVQIVDDIK